jgi:hypothetical protein
VSALILGELLGIGTYASLHQFTDIALGVWAVALLARRGRWPQWWVWLLAGTVAVTGLWSPVPWLAPWAGGRILALAVIATNIRRDPKMLATGLALGLAPQLAVFAMQLGDSRPRGLSPNAFAVAETGVYAFMLGTYARHRGLQAVSGIMVGFPVTRAALLAVWVFALAKVKDAANHKKASGESEPNESSRPKRYQVYVQQWHVIAPVVLITLVFLGHAALNGDIRRLSPSELSRSASMRADTIEGNIGARMEVIAQFGEDAPEYHDPEFRLLGYGHAGYLWETGLPRPHTTWLVIPYEYGLLSLVPFGLLLWLLWRQALPWPVVLGVFVMSLFSADQIHGPEEHYLFAALAMCFARTTEPLSQPARRLVRRLRAARAGTTEPSQAAQ